MPKLLLPFLALCWLCISSAAVAQTQPRENAAEIPVHPATGRFFFSPEQRREILFYDILKQCGVPTLRVLARTEQSLLLEDLETSPVWRLGQPDDMDSPQAARAIAGWYRKLHAADYPARHELPGETDTLTEENLRALAQLYPNEDFWPHLFANYNMLRARLQALPQTLVYSDFYWTNLAVARDGIAALMFDYNMAGRGYAYSDVRNVASSLGERAARAFREAYGAVHSAEQAADKVASVLCTLWLASRRENFPQWAQGSLIALRDGSLLRDLKAFLS